MGLEIDDPSLSWIDKDFLERILSTKNSAKISVSKFNIMRAVGKGENYGSLLLRVSIEYDGDDTKNNRTSLIIKTLPLGEMMQMLLTSLGAFPRENRVYLETIPAMVNLMKRKLPNNTEEMFVPLAFPCERPGTLVLEDLKERKFRMSDRRRGLDLQHILLVLRKLAKYHAASVALQREDPSKLEGYEEAFYTDQNRAMLEQLISSSHKTLASIIEEWEGFEKYGNKIREFTTKAIDSMVEMVKSSNSFLPVLNHGDCWVNNVMFKYNEVTGEVEDVVFVDLPLSRYASPALDLLYFIYSSVQSHLRSAHYQRMLMEYHFVMNDTLEALGCGEKKFSMDQLEEEIRQKEAFGFGAACAVLSAVLVDPEDAVNLDSVTEEEFNSGQSNFMETALRGRRFREEMQVLLPLFEQKGVL
ncbi:uncharacterized protein [Anabrus simplex]|uniref:uncharacterized protein n=1 Tax=Anabrus simplex TaxID=316456 RepID=UPI0035A3C0E8